MDGSDKVSSSSRFSEPSANPRFIPIADENDLYFDQLATMKPKKQPMKHFMSPTISASSKAAIPRKKILAERNGSSYFTETHCQYTQNLDQQSSNQYFSQKTHVQDRVSLSDDEEQNTHLSDMSSKPYDPLTNYLSPRPKFLRYNPNKRREIFNLPEDEIERENDGSDPQSFSASSQEGSEKNEIEEIDKNDQDLEADEEIEEFEKESCFSLKGVLKFLLVSVILWLLTWYVSTMNSSTPSTKMQVIRGTGDKYFNDHYSAYNIFDYKIFYKKFLIASFPYEVGLVKSVDEKIEVVEKQKGLNGEVFYHVSDQKGDICLETGKDVNEDGFDGELDLKELGFVDFKQEEAENVNDYNSGKEMEGCDRLKGIEIAENAEKSESFEEYQTPPPISDWLDNHVSEDEVQGNSISKDSEVETGDKMKTIDGILVRGDDEVEENKMERVDNAEVGKSIEFSTTKHPNYDLICGLAIGFLAITPFILMFYFKCRKTATNKSLPIEEPLYNTFQADKISSENLLFANVEETPLEKVESLANPSSYFRLEEANLNGFSQSRAPTVELLGEFVVGDVSSSMKGCGMKSKTKKNEVKSKVMEIEGETSSMIPDKGPLVSDEVELSTPEFSVLTMNSSSYGRFTAEKKIMKKEDGAVVTTPARRSSRIRNRAISP